jgi:hypothetical protein
MELEWQEATTTRMTCVHQVVISCKTGERKLKKRMVCVKHKGGGDRPASFIKPYWNNPSV